MKKIFCVITKDNSVQWLNSNQKPQIDNKASESIYRYNFAV